jgi:hypothetical protein
MKRLGALSVISLILSCDAVPVAQQGKHQPSEPNRNKERSIGQDVFTCSEASEDPFLYEIQIQDVGSSLTVDVAANEDVLIGFVFRGETSVIRRSLVATQMGGRATLVLSKNSLFGNNTRGVLSVGAVGADSRLNAKTLVVRFDGGRIMAPEQEDLLTKASSLGDGEVARFNTEIAYDDGAEPDGEQ